MITLTVTHLHGRALTPPPQARFDETGGTIGRADTSTLVLPDPERNVSRLQARIVFRSGRYAVVDQGGNPMQVNGRALGSGREALLAHGDELLVGGYLLKVETAAAQKAAADPFAGFTDFGGLAKAPAPAPAPLTVAAAAAPAPAGGIPADWDPFASAAVPAASAGGALGLGLPAAKAAQPPVAAPAAASLDALFGLGDAVADPLAGSPLAAPLAQPNMAAHADPVQALRQLPAALPPATPDVLPEVRRPFAVPPPAGGAVRSWETGAAAASTLVQPVGAPAPVPSPAPAPIAPAAPPAAVDADPLQAALHEGLGVPGLALPPLTPEFMRLLGTLLRESAHGTTQLLQARAAMKRELRAEATMIAPRENNPLKFSPNADAALTQMLGPTLPGFHGPQRALREAFEDLRAHELGFLAGMRAAIEALLSRFDPAALEARLVPPGGLAGLLPGSRKSQLWHLFEAEYHQIADEVADDAQQLFGREFLQAYEAQVAALDRTA